tara:strand:- start:85489 stop:85884 length:396 start_codon:yes stop_codon:yes gene_type:complete
MIEIVINGYGKVSKKANFGVLLKDDRGQTHQRIVPLEVKSSYAAELLGIKYGLLTLHGRDYDILVKTSSPHVSKSLTKKDGEWPKSRSKSMELLDEIRTLAEEFGTFECVFDKSSPEMDYVKELARKPIRS